MRLGPQSHFTQPCAQNCHLGHESELEYYYIWSTETRSVFFYSVGNLLNKIFQVLQFFLLVFIDFGCYHIIKVFFFYRLKMLVK